MNNQQVLRIINGKASRVEIKEDGGRLDVYTTVNDVNNGEINFVLPENIITENYFETMFKVVDLDNISVKDNFLQHHPENQDEKRVIEHIMYAKDIGLANFRKPVMDPSFNIDNSNIVYVKGGKPAVGRSPIWWEQILKNFMPSKNSRMCTPVYYDVFLGTRVKYLVSKEHYHIDGAWKAVCKDSRDLGNYLNSKNARRFFEETGSRPVGKWYDLTNTGKILKKDDGSGYLIASCPCGIISYYIPLSGLDMIISPTDEVNNAGGAMIMDV